MEQFILGALTGFFVGGFAVVLRLAWVIMKAASSL